MAWKWIRRLFLKTAEEPENVDALRIEFKERYHSFKRLLGANQKALEMMTEIEQAMDGDQPFGMSFIRSHCTAMTVNVFKMIQHLNRLSPGRHEGLKERFNIIRREIETILNQRPITEDRRLVIPLDAVDISAVDAVGGKMANLGDALTHTGIKAPPGFVITAAAYKRFLDENSLGPEIDRRFQATDLRDRQLRRKLSTEIQALIRSSPVPEDIVKASVRAWEQLEMIKGRPILMALRSSAICEDTAGSSFAGQYRSVLNVSRENLLHAYREILASKYSPQAIAYRLNKGFRSEDISMCVGCMAMVDARAGGVIYSRNPLDPGDYSIHIISAFGLPKAVVDGSAACDLFVVSRKSPLAVIRKEIRTKTQKFICDPEEGVCRMELTGDERTRPSIDQAHVIRLAREALALEIFYGVPQDIEWAMEEDGRLFVLQCRPLAQAEVPAVLAPPAGVAGGDPLEDTLIFQGGITASAGSASGRVVKVDLGADLVDFPRGRVLVARQALPGWAPLLNRAAAMVTEQGGMASHLANVAREFRVPALFGVEGALEKLSSGDLVTVDATGCAVHQGRIEHLSGPEDRGKHFMTGSPVYQTLKEVSLHMVHLNLLNPDSPDFNPGNCRTFHDITRYVHEKSVQEMFNFGKAHGFAERSSKQLHFHRPMKWWILNLDDGFTREIRGKYVKLSQIASLPMLAFWEGFAAIPWDGPPMDGKGLVSVMFQSTANTALTLGTRHKFADRNYFIISKNYCNLSSRLGYHFSILEALVGDRKRENYLTFQFKGGATDEFRRYRRIRFIGEILARHRFRLRIEKDHLTARMEGQDKDYMLDRIKILGYLSLHTRQLDMIMSNKAKTAYYAEKISRDIDSLLKA